MAAAPPSYSSLDVPDGREGRHRPDINAVQSPRPHGGGDGGLYSAQDPRTSSTQSLVPSLPEYEEFARRKLLVIYIHGFMGNDTSFQSFPLHVHRFLKEALAETHVIHSKIYPRYKTYKAIEVARDNFSRWLEPHESPSTDIVLVGHSMGGLLAADVILMPGRNPQRPFFKHRILGAVHLDSPILGLHPGIVVSGISSLFRPKPDKQGQQTASGSQGHSGEGQSNVLSPTQSLHSEQSFESQSTMASSLSPALSHAGTFDPNFDPSFPNDVRLQDRGWWRNVVHFAKKHNSEGLIDAATKHIMSHLEFGSCLLDISCLKNRYENVRKLEDMDDIKNYGFPHVPPQVRFAQYYTVCYGFPKVLKAPKEEGGPQSMTQSSASITTGNSPSTPGTPGTSGDNHDDRRLGAAELSPIPKEIDSPSQRSTSDWSGSELEMLEPEPIPDDEPITTKSTATNAGSEVHHSSEPDARTGTKQNMVGTSKPAAGEQSNQETSPGEGGEIEQPPQDPPKIVQESATGTITDLTNAASSLTLDLTAIPALPSPPELPDLEKITDKDAKKQAERESKRLLKAYEQAVKDRNKAIKERDKIVEKRQKKIAQEAEKREKEAQKQAKHAERQRQKDMTEEARKKAEAQAVAQADSVAQSAAAAAMPDGQLSQQTSVGDSINATTASSGSIASPRPDQITSPKPEKEKKKKERKFINMPSKINGQADPKWVKVFMKDMDETAAHTSLFFTGEHYEKLVGDVSDLIVQWVQYDLTKKAIMDVN